MWWGLIVKTEWIRAASRLPPYNERVLIASKIGGEPQVYVGARIWTDSQGERWNIEGNEKDDYNVAFWMELPPVPGISDDA